MASTLLLMESMTSNRAGIALLAMALAIIGFSRGDGAQYDNNDTMWLNFFNDSQIGETPLGLHLDGQYRRDNLGLNNQQLLIQPGLTYKLPWGVDAGSGYGYMRTYPYGEHPVPRPVPEHRIWEQISKNWKVAGLSWNTRFRLEQRQIGEFTTGASRPHSFRYENRLRFRLLTRFSVPFVDDDRYYMKVSDEIFINAGKNVGRNQFDQNRAYLAVGRKLNNRVTLECGFMEQTLKHRDGQIIENNHTLMITLNADLFGRK